MQESVRGTNATFADAIARRDAAAAPVYSKDAGFLPLGSDPLAGRPAAQHFWQQELDAGVCRILRKTLDSPQVDAAEPTRGDRDI